MKYRVPKAVTELRKKLLNIPVLGYPNDMHPYTLTTDASLTGIEAILSKNKKRRLELLHMLAKLLVKVSGIIQQLSGNYLQLNIILLNILKTIYLVSTFQL